MRNTDSTTATKHTPGPWEISDECSISDYRRIRAVNDGQYVCVCDSAIVCAAQKNKANARLIAAAPELLEACINVRAFMGDKPSDDRDSTYDNGVRALIDQLESAISKAQGTP